MSEQELIFTSASMPSSTMTLTRRRVLQMIAATGTASAMTAYPFFAEAATAGTGSPESNGEGYGIDPNLFKPEVPWGKSLSSEELRAVQIIGDIIIPDDEHSPKASDLDIADFVNEWVSAPYPQQQQDRTLVIDGLAWLDQQAEINGGKRFIDIAIQTQTEIFDHLANAVESESASDVQTAFFNRIVYLFVGGFYTTQEGMTDIGYVGNVPLPKFDGPPAEIRQRLGL